MDIMTLLSLGQALQGFRGGQKVAKPTYGEQTSMTRSQDINRLSQALGDPNDPLYKQFETQEMDAALSDYSQSLQSLINQNRRMRSMGRTPLFDEERGAEQIFRAGLLGRNAAGQQARDLARKRIAGAIEAGKIGSGVAMQTSDAQRARRSATSANQLGLLQDIGDVLQRPGSLSQGLGFGSQPQVNVDNPDDYFRRPGYGYTGF